MNDNDELKRLYASCGDDDDDAKGKESSSTKQKTKRALTLAERINVIRMAEKIPSIPHLSRTFACSGPTIRRILRHRQEYLDVWSNNGNNAHRTLRKRSLGEIAVDTIVYEWIQRCRSNGVPITDYDIRQIGQRTANILNIMEFRPDTKSWLQRLKRAYKLNDLDLLGLNPTVNGSDIMKESTNLEDIIANFRDPEHPLNLKDITVFLYLEETFSTSLSSSSLFNQRNQVVELKESESETELEPEIEPKDVLESELKQESELADSVKSVTKPVLECEIEPEIKFNAETKLPEKKRRKTENTSNVQQIKSYNEALNHLGPLEHFSLLKEDFRAVGLINQLENLFKEKMQLQEGRSNCDKKK